MKITALKKFKSIAIDHHASLPTLASTLALVFLLTLFAAPAAPAQTFSVIYAFTGSVDGRNPQAGLTLRGGNLYGSTYLSSFDAVFEMQRSGSDWAFTPLVKSSGASTARVLFGPDGHLYGTNTQGGGHNGGFVFNVIPPVSICKVANCGWKQNVIYPFQNIPDGAVPGYGDLIWDQQGNMYGTTSQGGQNGGGAVYELRPSGNGWSESVLYSFTGADTGLFPTAGVVLDNNGSLLGTTSYGGAYGVGLVYALKYVVGVGWTETVIHSFQNMEDGSYPQAGLVADGAGNFYGASSQGGSGGGGSVFELSPSGDSYAFRLLYSFSAFLGPYANLTLDNAGNLYGTTYAGGVSSNGSIFKLTITENGWVYTSLHDFTGGNDGANPNQ